MCPAHFRQIKVENLTVPSILEFHTLAIFLEHCLRVILTYDTKKGFMTKASSA